MLGMLLGAAILGVIIVVMERDEFPGWGSMIVCVLAAEIPALLVTLILGPSLFIVGVVVGAICCGFAISALLGMPVNRACIAAGIYLAIRVAIGLALGAALSTPRTAELPLGPLFSA